MKAEPSNKSVTQFGVLRLDAVFFLSTPSKERKLRRAAHSKYVLRTILQSIWSKEFAVIRKSQKTKIVAFKVEEDLAEFLGKLKNKSEFIRKAILAQFSMACPLCRGPASSLAAFMIITSP